MKIPSLVLILAFPALLFSQWDTNGDNSSSGNLKIGSSTNDNIPELTIVGPNQPLGAGSARDINFDFAAAGEAVIRAYRGGSWDTYLQFLTMPYNGGSPKIRMHIAGDGRVGVGTSSPGTSFEVNGHINLGSNLSDAATQNNSYGNKLYFLGAHLNTDPLWISRFNSSYDVSELRVNIGDNLTSLSDKFVVGTTYGNLWQSHFTVQSNGFVGIGTSNPDSQLAVKGLIHAQEVKVDLNGAVAPDYVFKEGYDLWSINAVEAYIDQNGHLPNIPSAAEFKSEGLNLKEMNLKLLEKIEELTLYIIDQNAKIENLELQNEKIFKWAEGVKITN
ncbi:hypothetical protein [Leeuwenhoekiella sp. H156]|uniref:hypothetical protein n=1 Tax=Leeuwenhoekiella sp. H156 TaxID=3450128 RepID=UPI003FA45918